MTEQSILQFIWDIVRGLLAVAVAFGLTRLIFISFDYIEAFQNRVNSRLFAVRRRWWHRFTKGSK